MNYKKIITQMLLNSCGYITIGATAGAIGAKILSDFGCSGYSILETARAGATGNAVVGLGIGLIRSTIFQSPQESKSVNCCAMATSIILGTTPTILGGVLGRMMISRIAEMPLANIAAAIAIGDGVLLTMGIAIVFIIGCNFLIEEQSRPEANHIANSDLMIPLVPFAPPHPS